MRLRAPNATRAAVPIPLAHAALDRRRVDDEVRFHLDIRTAELMQHGMSEPMPARKRSESSEISPSQNAIVAPRTKLEREMRWSEWADELGNTSATVTDAELRFARTNRTAGLPASMESNNQVADAVSNIIRNNLPSD